MACLHRNLIAEPLHPEQCNPSPFLHPGRAPPCAPSMPRVCWSLLLCFHHSFGSFIEMNESQNSCVLNELRLFWCPILPCYPVFIADATPSEEEFFQRTDIVFSHVCFYTLNAQDRMWYMAEVTFVKSTHHCVQPTCIAMVRPCLALSRVNCLGFGTSMIWIWYKFFYLLYQARQVT